MTGDFGESIDTKLTTDKNSTKKVLTIGNTQFLNCQIEGLLWVIYTNKKPLLTTVVKVVNNQQITKSQGKLDESICYFLVKSNFEIDKIHIFIHFDENLPYVSIVIEVILSVVSLFFLEYKKANLTFSFGNNASGDFFKKLSKDFEFLRFSKPDENGVCTVEWQNLMFCRVDFQRKYKRLGVTNPVLTYFVELYPSKKR